MDRVPLAVTISGKCREQTVARAMAAAREWSLPFIPRRKKSALGPLFENSADALLVFGAQDLVLRHAHGSLRFSPGLARLRIKRLEAGVQEDILVRLAEFRQGDRVLDCTLGLGADALVAAHMVGKSGQVVALEKSLPLFALMSTGLSAVEGDSRSSSIEVHHADAAEHLARQPDGSFDCVLLDPMFERPRRSSPAFDALRYFADYSPVTLQMLREAARVARRVVVIKGPRPFHGFARLGLDPEPGSPYATVAWARVPGIGYGRRE